MSEAKKHPPKEVREAHAALTALGAPEGGTLAERINLLGEELAATEDLNHKLLDPEFTFTGDGIRAIDARGLVQSMVLSFDKMLRDGGASNFMTFEVGSMRRERAYVVTVQKATGKTPAEAYIEVARELQELKAQHCPECAMAQSVIQDDRGRCLEHAPPPPPPPPEEEPPPAPPHPLDHLKLDLKTSQMVCENCGKKQDVPRPVTAGVLNAMQDAFTARHARCKPRKAGS